MSVFEDDGYVFQYSYQFGDTIVRVYKNAEGDVIERADDHSYSSSH